MRLLRDGMRCWYELRWIRKPDPGLLLRIHKNFIAVEQPIKLTHQTDRDKEAMFGRFASDPYNSLGFGGPLKYVGEDFEFAELFAKLPACQTLSEQPCTHCKRAPGPSAGLAAEVANKCLQICIRQHHFLRISPRSAYG